MRCAVLFFFTYKLYTVMNRMHIAMLYCILSVILVIEGNASPLQLMLGGRSDPWEKSVRGSDNQLKDVLCPSSCVYLMENGYLWAKDKAFLKKLCQATLYDNAPKCTPHNLIMENGDIPDPRIAVPTFLDPVYKPEQVRLNFKANEQGVNLAEVPIEAKQGEWIQVDLGDEMKVTAVATQGNGKWKLKEWTKSYTLQYSNDGQHFEGYDGGRVFTGNDDRDTVVKNRIDPPIIARFIKLVAKTWHEWHTVRLELYGCPLAVFGKFRSANRTCTERPLGMENGSIPDSSIIASSYYYSNSPPHSVQMNNEFKNRVNPGSWRPAADNRIGSEIQVYLGNITTVSGIATQGSSDLSAYIKSYKLAYSKDGQQFTEYLKGVALDGNTADRVDAIVKNKLRPVIKARYIRIYPLSWHGHIAMRFELFGCNQGDPVRQAAAVIMAEQKEEPLKKPPPSKPCKAPNGPVTPVQGNASPQQLMLGGRNDPWKKSVRGSDNQLKDVLCPSSCVYLMENGYLWAKDKAFLKKLCQATLYDNAPKCTPHSLGMESGDIPDESIVASSFTQSVYKPEQGRMNFEGNVNGINSAWEPSEPKQGEWIQVDLGDEMKVTAVATQGNSKPFISEWTTSYSLQYSNDGRYFEDYDGGRVFSGNNDRDTVVKNRIDPPIIARYIRVVPKTWKNWNALRLELYGCLLAVFGKFRSAINVCIERPLGMESGTIPDSRITASSYYYSKWPPHNARLNNQFKNRVSPGSWRPLDNRVGSWIQVDLGNTTIVSEVAVQGSPTDRSGYTKTYKVAYSNDGQQFTEYLKGVALDGNKCDHVDAIVKNKLRPVIKARYIRIYPLSWHGHIEMRFELFGCRKEKEKEKEDIDRSPGLWIG